MSDRVILASASASRAHLLSAAGVPFTAIATHVDEDAVKSSMKAEGATAIDCAEALAELKAVKISQAHRDVLVIGADQMLECEGRWFDKPPSVEAARAHLVALSGRTHTLPTAVVVARNGARIWQHRAVPKLSMRTLTPAFLETYLAQAGKAVLSSVGAYQLEGSGVQLFQAVDGDFFTILGLPMLPLLSFLQIGRAHV